MKFFIPTGRAECISLPFADEKALAQSVMDAIASRRVKGEFQDLLDRIYYVKCTRGAMFTVDEMYQLLDYMERYDLEAPEFADTTDDIWSDLSPTQFPTKEDRLLECRRMVIQAWREVWDTHTAHKAVADGYKRFPGDEYREAIEEDTSRAVKHYEFRKQQEKKLDEEIRRMMDEWGCTYADAFREASDWIPMPEHLDDYD